MSSKSNCFLSIGPGQMQFVDVLIHVLWCFCRNSGHLPYWQQ